MMRELSRAFLTSGNVDLPDLTTRIVASTADAMSLVSLNSNDRRAPQDDPVVSLPEVGDQLLQSPAGDQVRARQGCWQICSACNLMPVAGMLWIAALGGHLPARTSNTLGPRGYLASAPRAERVSRRINVHQEHPHFACAPSAEADA